MKSKKSLLSLGLLVLVLVLGVGYATINATDLTISGSATASAADMNVYFTGTPQTTNATNGKVVASVDEGDITASITVTDIALNETVSATYTIQNDEELDGVITEKSVSVLAADGQTDLTDHFEVTTSLKDGGQVEITKNSGTAEVTVYVKLVKTPTDPDYDTADITVVFTATPVVE